MLELSNEKAFSTALKKYADHVKKTPQAIAKIVMLDINQRAIDRSRVDTGRYVGGWLISYDEPSKEQSNYVTSTEKTNESTIKNTQIDQNQAKILNFNKRILYLSNNVEYAIYREFGTPTQSPDYTLTGAVQATINRLNTLIKELEFKG